MKSPTSLAGACTAAVLMCLTTTAADAHASTSPPGGLGVAAARRPPGFQPAGRSSLRSSATTRRISGGGLETLGVQRTTGGGMPPPQQQRRRRRTPAMLVETDVKVKGESGIGHGSGSSDSSSSSGKSGSAAADASEGTGPPPVPVDTFRHKSLAEVPTDYGPYLTIKGFKINAFGFFFCFMALFWAIPWGVFLILYKASVEYMDKIDPRRYNVDRSSALWGWLTSISTDSLPDITGTENIPKGPAVFVANHASWMDVPYTAQLPVRAKYLAKADLAKIPILGNAMSLAQHVLLDRDDKRSQMEALRSALLILKSGTPIFVFPEGTRGPQGRMQTFKMGAFKVATKAGVPIVPVSIAGTHVMMPKEVIMPQCAGRGITAIHVHPPISTKGRTDQELSDLAFDIINNALSDEQRALPSTKKDEPGA